MGVKLKKNNKIEKRDDVLLMRDLCKRNIVSRSKVMDFFLDEKNRENIGLNRIFKPESDDENRLFDKEWKQENCIIAIKKLPIGLLTKFDYAVEYIWKTFPVKWKMCIWQFIKGDCNYHNYASHIIRFTETKVISLKNVVVFGDLVVTVNADEIHNLRISIEHSYIFGTLKIYSVDSTNLSLYCYSSAIDEVKLLDSKFDAVDFNNVSIGLLELARNKIKTFSLFESNIESLKINRTDFEEKKSMPIYMSVINIRNTFTHYNQYKWKKAPPAFCKEKRSSKKQEQIQTSLDTIDFLRQNSSCLTQSELTEINYQYGKIGMKPYFSYFYRFFGGMYNPLIFVLLSVLTIFLFAIAYYAFPGSFGPDAYFSFDEEKKFMYALYFSAVTLTTTGYGDLHPNENIMFFASLEGLLGILFGGAFLVSLTRRCFERNSV